VTVAAGALLAAELTHKTLWNPTILGVLVFISAVGLFCGSVYLLLATNLGARLGFLVSAAALSGFLVLLSILWMTTATPLNSPKGLESKWVAKEVVNNPADAKIQKVDDIERTGTKIPTDDLANVRPFIDAALIVPNPATAVEGTVPSPFAKYASSSLFIVGEQGLKAYDIGGGSKNIFFHKPRYAAVEFCNVKVDPADVPFGEAPPTPTCDPLVPHQWMILERDLGSIRQPPIFYFIGFSILFGLSLLGLHWYELDHRQRQARGVAPVPASS
jgi:hypothetical protein